jgi:plastocyanin
MKPRLTLFALPLSLVAVAACGSSSRNTQSGAATPSTPTISPAAGTPTSQAASADPSQAHTVAIEADPSGQLKYTKSSLSTSAGEATIEFTNSSPLPHDVVLTNSSNAILGQTPIFQGGTKSFIVRLTPGTYTYYCSVPGHRQAGMQGTLTVS